MGKKNKKELEKQYEGNKYLVPAIIIIVGVIIGGIVVYSDLNNGTTVDTSDEGIDRELVEYANEIGLNIQAFETCYNDRTYEDVVQEDLNTALQLDIGGTPAFFVNGTRISGAQPTDVFRQEIENALNDPETDVNAVGGGYAETKGNPDAPVHIVEFTDYDCPFCARYVFEILPNIMTEYVETGQVKYSVRNMPLEGLHPHAVKYAEASMCANEQGKYWEYHDILFEKQEERLDH